MVALATPEPYPQRYSFSSLVEPSACSLLVERQQRVLDQEAAYLRAMVKAFIDLEQQGLHIGALRMRALAGLGRLDGRIRHHAPLEEGKEGAIALHHGIMVLHESEGVLVKDTRVWYHRSKLLAGQVGD